MRRDEIVGVYKIRTYRPLTALVFRKSGVF
jgi:hypothetical protein